MPGCPLLRRLLPSALTPFSPPLLPLLSPPLSRYQSAPKNKEEHREKIAERDIGDMLGDEEKIRWKERYEVRKRLGLPEKEYEDTKGCWWRGKDGPENKPKNLFPTSSSAGGDATGSNAGYVNPDWANAQWS